MFFDEGKQPTVNSSQHNHQPDKNESYQESMIKPLQISHSRWQYFQRSIQHTTTQTSECQCADQHRYCILCRWLKVPDKGKHHIASQDNNAAGDRGIHPRFANGNTVVHHHGKLESRPQQPPPHEKYLFCSSHVLKGWSCT